MLRLTLDSDIFHTLQSHATSDEETSTRNSCAVSKMSYRTFFYRQLDFPSEHGVDNEISEKEPVAQFYS